jgi:fructoselysine 6-kinase
MAGIVAATVGDNCIDRYLPLGRSTVGGNAVNVAVHLCRLGLGSAYFGAVGDDRDGGLVRAALRANRVDTAHLRIVPDIGTGTTDITFGPGGERIIGHEDLGACATYRPTPSEIAVLSGMRHVHIGWLDDGGAVKRALAAGGTDVSQDLSVSSPSAGRSPEGLAVAFASAGASLDEGDAVAAALLGAGARTAVVTCGRAGSVAASAGATARMDARPVAVVDTLGAGDTFIAGFLAARLQGEPLEACLRKGRDAAAATCGHLGGFPQEPGMLT